jgi:O-antigen/teichoic acid export membrane protein
MIHDRCEMAADSLRTTQGTAPSDGFYAHPAAPAATAELSPAWVTRQSAVNMAGGVISQGLKFLVVIYAARTFSVSDFGLFSFAVAVNAYIFVMACFGLPTYGSRAVALATGELSQLLLEIWVLRAALGLCGTLVCVAILGIVPQTRPEEILLLLLFGCSNIAVSGLFDWVYQGLNRQDISALLNVLWQGGWLGFTVLGIRLGLRLAALPLALCLAGFAAALTSVFLLPRTSHLVLSIPSFPGLFRRCWATLILAAPLGWGTLLLNVVVWSDVIWLRYLRGETAVGLYAAGNRGPLALSMLATFYVQGAFPTLSKAAAQGSKELFEQCFQQVYADLALVFVPGVMWSMVYAEEILRLVFGRADYVVAVPIFRAFLIALLLYVANNLLGTGVLVARSRDREFRKVLGGTTCIFLVLSPYLTWRSGIMGAAWAAVATQALSCLWFCFLSRDEVRPRHFSALLLPSGMGLVTLTICRLYSLSFSAGIALIASSYAALVLLRIREQGLLPERA